MCQEVLQPPASPSRPGWRSPLPGGVAATHLPAQYLRGVSEPCHKVPKSLTDGLAGSCSKAVSEGRDLRKHCMKTSLVYSCLSFQGEHYLSLGQKKGSKPFSHY